MDKFFSSKFDRNEFIKSIIKEKKQDWLYHEIKKNDNQHGNHLAWALSAICDNDATFLDKFKDDILEWLPGFKTQGIKRSILRSVDKLSLSIDKEGEWVDFLFEVVISTESDVAVKVHAIEILSKYVIQYEELANELLMILEDGMAYYSPALKARSKRIIKRLKKAHINI